MENEKIKKKSKNPITFKNLFWGTPKKVFEAIVILVKWYTFELKYWYTFQLK